LLADNRVTVKRKDDSVVVQYNPQSESSEVPRPMCRLEIIQACTGVENMITVEVLVSDVAECRSKSLAKFNKPNLVKFDKILENSLKLFTDRLAAAHRIDAEQIAWESVVSDVEKISNYREQRTKRQNSDYEDTEWYFGNVVGRLYDYYSGKTFDVRLENLTPEQMRILGPILAKL